MTATGPASPRYVEDAVAIICKVHRSQGPGHVLAFFTGQDEIEKASGLLSEAVAKEKEDRRAIGIDEEVNNGVSDLQVVPLFGALSAEAQAEAFKPARPGVRKVMCHGETAQLGIRQRESEMCPFFVSRVLVNWLERAFGFRRARSFLYLLYSSFNS